MALNEKQEREKFKLRIAGVSLGTHRYSMTCDKTFFELTELSELQDGVVNVQIEMENSEKMLILDFNFEGTVFTPCDRCLDLLSLKLNFSEQLIVKLVADSKLYQNEDNIWYIDENEYELDIFHFVYESICLALPMQKVHADDENGNSTCNSDILERINALSAKETSIDPRWEALQHIKDLNH
ncbi:MAG TPA: DUF177 domain-containing protein [Bacteroidales bacterium]|jgi:uncharacterized protein|nr:DUF177 domain-containing protein [Bacteroidales bacterium]HOS57793.1 DUF177 domain-containing protein [Bacteroidales bacterium]HPY80808.1 DUF177 domain-containing protein [Bacteroidales bacterium]HQA87366.1 DUF177 domain-containing protein [Bacteroidales bacterium]HRR04105.1 DUF177 domain-containing protein [Bacteroidales bacterium]